MPHRPAVALSSLAFLAAIIGAFLVLRAPADAATISTDTFADELNTDGDCSLREAIRSANLDMAVDACVAGSGTDTIVLDVGTYTLSIPTQDEDAAATGDLDILGNLTISGAGTVDTIIEACAGVSCTGVDRVLEVLSGTVNISALTIRNGDVIGPNAFVGRGGGINTAGGSTLNLSDTTVSDSSATGGGGGIHNGGTMDLTTSTVSGNISLVGSTSGGIFNNGTLTLTNSTVSGNSAPSVGGILNNSTLTLTNSTVSGNTSTGNGSGGGIFNNTFGTATITSSTISGNSTVGSVGAGVINFNNLTLANSTVSGNMSSGDGGGIYNTAGTATITNSTVSNNTSDNDANDAGDGGGIFRFAGTVDLKNTILAGNHDLSPTTQEPDCFGELTSSGYNLIQTISAGCTIVGDTATNVTGQSANLGPLALNAPGTTETHAIQAGSPAIDFASADCPPPATDQRGVTRPAGNRCDIGAYESSFSGPTPVPTAIPSPTPTPSPTPSPSPTTTATPTPTATPPGQTPSPTPTPTPPGQTPSPTAPGQTPTPTSIGSATATPSDTGPTDTPTSNPTGGQTVTWGDDNCSGEADPIDSLLTLRHDAGLSVNTGACPDMGEVVEVSDASPHPWGDIDCSGEVNPIDSLKLLRFDAGLPVSQEPACPEPGEQVTIQAP